MGGQEVTGTTGGTSQQALDLVLAVHRLVRSLRHGTPNAGLQPTQLIVLSQLLESGTMRLGELAAKVPCSQPSATTLVSGLETLGLVRREADPADRRAVQVALTDEGRATIVSVGYKQADLLGERIVDLTQAERKLLADALPLLRRLARPRP